MEQKKPWQSKTNWFALIVAVAAFFPVVQSWISENPMVFAELVSGLFFVLRMITKGKVSIS